MNNTNTTTHTALVHKKDAEGALIIDALTGHIIQDPMERPDWSEGLSVALLGERLGYYNTRLGHHFTDDMKKPEAYAYEDLGWIGVDGEGDPLEIEADAEHRMSVIAEVLGVNREDGTVTGTVAAEVEIAFDKERTGDEVAALELAQSHGFEQATGTR